MSRRFSALSFRLCHASPHARFRLWLAGAVIVGVALRLYQITDQIIADDEWHAIHAAMSRSYLYLLSHFGPADYCIPLAVYTKLAMQTVGVSEMILRAPVLLAGIASLLAFPLIILEWRGPRIGAIAAWLLAISPIHIYYSRYARPYAISLLLVVLAWAAFRRWHQGKRSRSKLVYAACSAASAYFHLIFLPAALAPLLWGFAEAILKGAKRERYDLRELALLTLGTALACLALLGLPLALGGGELLAKAGKDRIDWYTVTGTAELLIGSGNGWTVCLALVGILAGAIALVRADRSLGACFAVIAGIQCLAIAVVHPNIVRKPIVLTRYGLALLPILLVLLASAIGAAEESIRSRWPRYPFGALAAAVVGMLLVTGPLPAINYYPNAWTNHGLFQYSYAFNPYARYDRLQPGHMSSFYDRLRASPAGQLLIVEAPWRYEWHYNPYPFYQRYHRQRMKVGFVAATAAASSLGGELNQALPWNRFENAVHVGDRRRLTRLGVDYVVFHKSYGARFRQWPAPFRDLDTAPWIANYRRTRGRPVFEDFELVVFKVKDGLR